MGQKEEETDEIGAEWWWVCTDFFHQGGKVVAGPFADRDLAFQFRTYYEAHPDARGRTFAIDTGPLALSGR